MRYNTQNIKRYNYPPFFSSTHGAPLTRHKAASAGIMFALQQAPYLALRATLTMLVPASMAFIAPSTGGVQLGPVLPFGPALRGKVSLMSHRVISGISTETDPHGLAPTVSAAVPGPPEAEGGGSVAAAHAAAVADLCLEGTADGSSSNSNMRSDGDDGQLEGTGGGGVVAVASTAAASGSSTTTTTRIAATATRPPAADNDHDPPPPPPYGSPLELKASAQREGVTVEALSRSRAFVAKIKSLPKFGTWETVLRELAKAEKEEARVRQREEEAAAAAAEEEGSREEGQGLQQKGQGGDDAAGLGSAGGGNERKKKARRAAMAGEAYATCLMYMSHSLRWREALGILDHVRAFGITPDVKSVSAALNACGLAGEWERCVRCGEMTCRLHVGCRLSLEYSCGGLTSSAYITYALLWETVRCRLALHIRRAFTKI